MLYDISNMRKSEFQPGAMYAIAVKQGSSLDTIEQLVRRLGGEFILPIDPNRRAKSKKGRGRAAYGERYGFVVFDKYGPFEKFMVNGSALFMGASGGIAYPLSPTEAEKVREASMLSPLSPPPPRPIPKNAFPPGLEVTIEEGIFAGWKGVVKDVPEKGNTITVIIPIFGRHSPVNVPIEHLPAKYLT